MWVKTLANKKDQKQLFSLVRKRKNFDLIVHEGKGTTQTFGEKIGRQANTGRWDKSRGALSLMWGGLSFMF